MGQKSAESWLAYGNESITARRFLALSKGIQGLSYRRKPIIGIEENEDETVETPLWIIVHAIAKFEAPGRARRLIPCRED